MLRRQLIAPLNAQMLLFFLFHSPQKIVFYFLFLSRIAPARLRPQQSLEAKTAKVLTIIGANLSCGQPISCTPFAQCCSTARAHFRHHESAYINFRISRVIVFAYVFIFGKCYTLFLLY